MLANRTHADIGQIWYFCNLVSVDVIAKDVPLCLCQKILAFHKLVKKLCNVGWKFSLLQSLASCTSVEELCQLIYLRDTGGHPLFQYFLLLEPFQTICDGADKSPRQKEGQSQ